MRQLRSLQPRLVGLSLLAFGASLLACGDAPTGPDSGTSPVVAFDLVDGDGQAGAVGSRLPTPVVLQVRDAGNQPVRGVAISFRVAEGGGTVTPAQVTTGADGLAKTVWTLGRSAADPQAIEAVAGGTTLPVVRVTAQATADLPAGLVIVSGDRQTAPTGATLAEPLVIKVVDAYQNPVSGVQVTWSADGGHGIVNPTISTTNADGEASTSRVAGELTGALTTSARVTGVAPIALAATVVSRTDLVPATIAKQLGDAQTAPVGTATPLPYAVVVKSAKGYPVQNATVRWAITTGGGALSVPTSRTNADGIATVLRTFGTAAGLQEVVATVEGLGMSVIFTGQATADGAAALGRAAGDQQAGTVGDTLAEPLVVVVQDKYGNPIPGMTVAWTVPAGQGSVRPSQSVTDATGHATARRVLGETSGVALTSASVSGLPGGPVQFTATALPGPVDALQPVTGNGQAFLPNTLLPAPYVVRAVDAYGNPVAGTTVRWAIVSPSSGGGTLSDTMTVTGADGSASVHHQLGSTAGTIVTEADLGDWREPVRFEAQVGAPTIDILGDQQAGIVATPLAEPIRVRVVSTTGQPLAGVTVRWSVVAGGGTVTVPASTTDGNGMAATTWTLGPRVGAHQLNATINGVTVLVTATATGPRGESRLEAVSGTGQTGIGGAALPKPFVVRVLDGHGAPVPGVTVRWAIAPGSKGAISAAQATTDADGRASVTATLPDESGAMLRVLARVDALEDLVEFTGEVAMRNVPATIEVFSGNNQPSVANQWLSDSLRAVVLDASRSPVAGVTVSWKVAAGFGVITAATSVTDARGVAAIAFRPSASVDAQRVDASVPGVATPASFTTNTATVPMLIVKILDTDQQLAAPGALLPSPLKVEVRDGANNLVSGVGVTWTVAGSDGGALSATPDGEFAAVATSQTNQDGVAVIWRKVGAMSGSASTGATLQAYPQVPSVVFTTRAPAKEGDTAP